jgi:hypothetical protein
MVTKLTTAKVVLFTNLVAEYDSITFAFLSQLIGL